jgi:hypothetical protein
VFDHSNTRVLLIGNSIFPKDSRIEAIPNVLANLELLKKSLLDTEVIGIPEKNITVLHNEDKQSIEEHLWTIAEETRHQSFTLLVYYTGHGILSDRDYRLYLSTNNTNLDRLVVTGLDTEKFKSIISGTNAATKIVILDCCHSGAIIGAMGDISGTIQAGLEGFTGTYVMTSAARDEPSLYPVKDSGKPTYFTGKLIDILNEGLDSESEYCSLRDIFNKIQFDLVQLSLPRPQQSNFNNADKLYFSKNKKYLSKKSPVDLAWMETFKNGSKWDYIDFRKQFPGSAYDQQAKQKIHDLDEEEFWTLASNKDTLSAYYDYQDKYPGGKHNDEADKKINLFREREGKSKKDEEVVFWEEMKLKDDRPSYENYLTKYSGGKFAAIARSKLDLLKQEGIKEKQFHDILRNANNLFNKGKYAEALPLFNEATALLPGRKEVGEKIIICKERIKGKDSQQQFEKLLDDANRHIINYNYDEARRCVEKSLAIFPGNQTSTRLLEEIREKAKYYHKEIEHETSGQEVVPIEENNTLTSHGVYKFLFLNFIISTVLSALYLFVFGNNSIGGMNGSLFICSVLTLSFAPAFLVFGILFSRLSKKLSIKKSKWYLVAVFLLTPFVYKLITPLLFDPYSYDGYPLYEAMSSFNLDLLTGKTYFLIPIISTLLLPVRGINSKYDAFKFSLLPFCCTLLGFTLLSVFRGVPSGWLILNVGGNIFGLMMSFTIFSLLLSHLLKKNKIVVSKIIASAVFLLYPIIMTFILQRSLNGFFIGATLSTSLLPIIFVFLFKIKERHPVVNS